MHILVLLKFTPLEFETNDLAERKLSAARLKFTPLEFETSGEFEQAKIKCC